MRQSAAEILAHFQFGVFAVKIWPEDHVCQVSRGMDQICDRRCIFKVFYINQDGGKSIMVQNDDIGCVELGLGQGIK